MAVVPLYNRSQLPPSRVGAVKPPYALADQSGTKAAGQGLTKFAGATFDRVVKARVANEEAEFHGSVKSAMAEYDAHVAANPGASFNDLEKARDKMISRMKTAGSSATMPQAKRSNASWLTMNLDSIRLQTQASMEAIQSKHQLATAEEISEGYINDFDKEGLVKFTKEQIASGLWEENSAVARLNNQLDIIDVAQKKVMMENLTSGLEARFFGLAETAGYPAAEAMLRDPEITKKLIEAGMDRKDIRSLLNDIEERGTKQQAQDRLELEARQETQLDNINKLMYSTKDYNGTTDAIEESELSEKAQGLLLKENNARAKLAANGQAETNDPVAVDKISSAINKVGNDTLSLDDAKKILNENRHLLKSEKVIEFQEELNKEFDRSIDTAYSRVRGDVRLRAIGKSESALDRLIEGIVKVKPGKDEKSLEERITTARTKFNLELDNFNRWEDSMRAWRRKNNEASPEEIQKEGMRSWRTDYSQTSQQLKSAAEKSKSKGPAFPLFNEALNEAKKKADNPSVRMQSPDGRTGTIPADQVEKAIMRGWKKL